jgi:hypothetical protein
MASCSRGWLAPFPVAWKRRDSFFPCEPELLRLQMLEGRRCGGRQLYTHSGKRRGEAVLFDLRQLIAADCSQSSFRVAFRNQEE